MNVLLIGSGGREDALAWALGRSPLLARLRCAPGNPGTARRAQTVPIEATEVEALVAHARQERYDLVVIGPEAPLVLGLADRLRALGITVFGPSAAAARLEGSKVFAKQFMARHAIPTAAFHSFDDATTASDFLRSTDAVYPLVIKADGLAAGKGVLFANDAAEAVAAAHALMVERRFGQAGRAIVVEELLRGREASFFVLCDGSRFVDLASCQDYKRALDGDRGPNTGGMGAYSPSVHLTESIRREVLARAVAPTIEGLAAEGHPYRGVLYVGVMLTDDGPKVLEFNARFGDPETQVLLPRLDGDWLELLRAAASGDLRAVTPRWKSEAAVCVVMTAGGYPGPHAGGQPIQGLERAERMACVEVFHAGTSSGPQGRAVTAGGRVLGVTALGDDMAAARERAYRAVEEISWDGERHRTDIALDAVDMLAQEERTMTEASPTRVAILIGSDSDLPVMSETAAVLKRLGVGFELHVTSAHRSPARTTEIVRAAESRGVCVFVAAAGGAAHLAGTVAAHTTRPVLGVPLAASDLNGLDSLLATVQMPAGVPVGTLAIGKAGAANAAWLAAAILALSDESLAHRLRQEREATAAKVASRSEAARQKLDELI